MTEGQPPDDEFEDSWPLTPRTILVFVAALDQLIAALDMDQATMRTGRFEPVESFAVEDFPRTTWGQPREWWVEVMKSADRVREGIHDLGWHQPRTVAEEAVVYVAATGGWVDVARDSDPDFGRPSHVPT